MNVKNDIKDLLLEHSPDKPVIPIGDKLSKRGSKFSITSILGEEDKKRAPEVSKSTSEIDTNKQLFNARFISEDKENSGLGDDTPNTLSTITPHFISDAAKSNAILTQFTNPDVAKLYRWPMFWNPFLSVQGALHPPGLTRPQLVPPVFLTTTDRNEALTDIDDGNKDGLEAGELVRQAFRRPTIDAKSSIKHDFPDALQSKNLSRTAPSPFVESRCDINTDCKFNNSDRKDTTYSESELDNDFVEIEVDEADDSDNEAGRVNISRHDDGIKGSACERKKKTRTVFSRSQIFQLETMFDMKRYLSSSERAGLAKALNMTETQVKIWFQNRRNKWKRQIAAEMEAANMSQVNGQRLMQLPYMYGHEEIPRGIRQTLPISPLHSGHPVVPASVHHYYGGLMRTHTS